MTPPFSASVSQCTTASSAQNANEEKAYILLLIGAAVSGLANSGLAILSMSYIDENTPKVLSPFYIGESIIYYRPQTKFAKVMFLQVSVCPQGGACVSHGMPPGIHARPPGNHTCPPASTRPRQPRTPPWHPRMPPGSHTHPPGIHACPLAATHAPRQPRMPPGSHARPPAAMHAPPIQEIYIFTAETHFLHLF